MGDNQQDFWGGQRSTSELRRSVSAQQVPKANQLISWTQSPDGMALVVHVALKAKRLEPGAGTVYDLLITAEHP